MAGFEQSHEGLENWSWKISTFWRATKHYKPTWRREVSWAWKIWPKQLMIIDYYEAHDYPTDSRSHKDNRSESVHMTMSANCTSVSQLTHLSEQSTVSTVGWIITTVASAGNHVYKESQATVMCAFQGSMWEKRSAGMHPYLPLPPFPLAPFHSPSLFLRLPLPSPPFPSP